MDGERETFLDTIHTHREDLEDRLKIRNSTALVNIWERSPPHSLCTYEDDFDIISEKKHKKSKKKKKDKKSKDKKDKKDKKNKDKKDKKRKYSSNGEDVYDENKKLKKHDRMSDDSIKEIEKIKERFASKPQSDSNLLSYVPNIGLSKGYNQGMLPGEADAIAQYVESNKRIPRRGEIGLSAEQIEKYENDGYVMSGSRHKRMNAVRIRKESQIYSAEEKRILEQLNYEEKAKKEERMVEEFRTILIERTRAKK